MLTYIIPCSYYTLGITLKFNACQIGHLHLELSKCCPALSEEWAPAPAPMRSSCIILKYTPAMRSRI